MTAHTGLVRLLAIRKEGQFISGSSNSSIKVWDIKTGKVIKTLEGHSSSVYSLAISKEGQFISGSADNTIIVWDIESG